MAERIDNANFYGDEYEFTSRGGGGGTGGGGMGITGGAYVPAEGGITTTNRWLRFDFDNPSHKALKILAGTTFSMGDTIIPFDEDTSINLSDYISEPGADYYVFVNADKRVVCSTLRTQPDGYMFIGQFHTLCIDCNENMTGLNPVDAGNVFSVGDTITLQNYFKERDLDFYNFYTKEIRAMNPDSSTYSLATVDHPLSGFKACDILPESVWCLNWHPVSKIWDGMVWCNSANICVDIYLQSGNGFSTRSEYGAVHTVSRAWLNQENDYLLIGKSLLSVSEFMQIATGSNELTGIYGGDQSVVGGHSDTSGRRMISFIGCEECCGYINQRTCHIAELSERNTWTIDDGRGLMGRSSDTISSILIGGPWDGATPYGGANYPGSRSISGRPNWFELNPIEGGRGCCNVTIV